jgi:hypothetical protein
MLRLRIENRALIRSINSHTAFSLRALVTQDAAFGAVLMWSPEQHLQGLLFMSVL